MTLLSMCALIYFAESRMRFYGGFHKISHQELLHRELNGYVSAVDNPSKSKIIVGLMAEGVKLRFPVYGVFVADSRIDSCNCNPKGKRFICSQSLKIYPGDLLQKKADDSIVHTGSGRFLLVADDNGM